ncbi:RidA family protein [Phyllobacterium sp. 22229]|uniref:RidA family protein n=1 Tax=Agrobacterium radiobacter TaxID=362 RepID=A0ABD5LN89_AGRRD
MVSESSNDLIAVRPVGWARPAGLSYGMVGANRRHLSIAGQLGGATGTSAPSSRASFAQEFVRSLENVVAVVESAGGRPADIAALRVYVTSIDDFKAAQPEIAEAWRTLLGRHFPAITMVEVSALFERRARVEIEGTALLRMEG